MDREDLYPKRDRHQVGFLVGGRARKGDPVVRFHLRLDSRYPRVPLHESVRVFARHPQPRKFQLRERTTNHPRESTRLGRVRVANSSTYVFDVSPKGGPDREGCK